MEKVTIGDSTYVWTPVTPAEVNKLSSSFQYKGKSANDKSEIMMVTLTPTSAGFDAAICDIAGNAQETYTCNNVTMAGGVGNAVIKLTTEKGWILRMEWINIEVIKFEWWANAADMAGQVANNPGRDTFALIC